MGRAAKFVSCCIPRNEGPFPVVLLDGFADRVLPGYQQTGISWYESRLDSRYIFLFQNSCWNAAILFENSFEVLGGTGSGLWRWDAKSLKTVLAVL